MNVRRDIWLTYLAFVVMFDAIGILFLLMGSVILPNNPVSQATSVICGISSLGLGAVLGLYVMTTNQTLCAWCRIGRARLDPAQRRLLATSEATI